MREDALMVLEEACGRGLDRVEVFAKRGRTRRFHLELGLESVQTSEEAGWALRAGDDRSSLFYAASGSPRLNGALDERSPGALRLPVPCAADDWVEPEAVMHPVLSEAEGRQLLAEAQQKLETEIPGCRLLDATIDDGASESFIVSNLGVESGYRSRACVARWEALGPAPALERAAVAGCAASGRELGLDSLLQRLVDILRIKMEGRPAAADGAAMILVPEVAARVLSGVVSLFVGASRERLAALLGESPAGVASERLTLIDDGRLEGGLLTAPVDGEGRATGRRVLLRAGVLGEPIQPWDVATGAMGCRRRPSWRDRPKTGASHFFVAPDPDVRPSSLLEDLDSGYYLVGSEELEMRADRLSLMVYGFEVAAGRPVAPMYGRLVWDPLSTLTTIAAVGRDLRFAPLSTMVGSPTILVTGWNLR